MAKFVKLNPYKEIGETVDNFLTRIYSSIETLMLRDDDVYKGKLREMSLSKPVMLNDMLIGMINVHIMNEKYNQQNWKTDRYSSSSFGYIAGTQGTNTEALNTNFVDERDILEIRVSIAQFESKALAQAPVKYSTIYKTFSNDTDRSAIAIKNKEVISHLWEDPAIVLATREYFKLAKPVLESWDPAISDVTVQTLFVR